MEPWWRVEKKEYEEENIWKANKANNERGSGREHQWVEWDMKKGERVRILARKIGKSENARVGEKEL